MLKYLFVLVVFTGAMPKYLKAQNVPAMQLDRPSQSECPYITPQNFLQIENGFNFEHIDANQRALYLPSTLWKFGLNEKFEFRLITEFLSLKKNGISTSGLMPITLGFKTALFEEKGILPKTSFSGYIGTSKLGSKIFQSQYLVPSFKFLMQHTLSKNVSLAYNLGAEWNGKNAQQTYLYTLNTGISLSSKLACYAEIYGSLPAKDSPTHACDGGFTYSISENFIIDLSAGVTLSPNAANNYLALGLSYRWNTNL